MPELPEAETITRQLIPHLEGRVLGRVTHSRRDMVYGDPRSLRRLLPGRRVQRVRRRGKRVILDLGPAVGAAQPVELVFHLGMTGRLTVCPADDPPDPHTHLRIEIDRTGCELRFRDPRRFGGVWCLTGNKRHVGRMLGNLGPEPLEISAGRFWQMLRRSRQIKALLLDQRTIAGLGNIYSDESLHAAGVHPLTQADVLNREQAGRLLRAIKATLRRAIRHNGSTVSDYRGANGEAGSFQRFHGVYQRRGEPCRTCGTPIERIIAAGRSTFLCPTCQPTDRNADERMPNR